MDKKKLLGILGVGFVGAYLYSSRNTDVKSHKLEGLDIKINPEDIALSGLDFINMNPFLKQQIKNGIKGISKGYREDD